MIIRLHPESTYGKAIMRLQTHYNLFFALVLLVFLTVYLPNYMAIQSAGSKANENVYLHAGILIAMFLLFVWAAFVQKPQGSAGSLEEKFENYKADAYKRYLMLSVALLLPAAGIWLSLADWYAAVFAIGIILFAALRPSAGQFARRMRLSKQEIELMREESKKAGN